MSTDDEIKKKTRPADGDLKLSSDGPSFTVREGTDHLKIGDAEPYITRPWLLENCVRCSKSATGVPCSLYIDSDCQCLDFSGGRYELLDPCFLEAMNKNMNGGNQKEGREPNDWKELDMSGFYGRLFAIERHIKAYRKTRELRHLAAIGCNAMICFWLQKNKGM